MTIQGTNLKHGFSVWKKATHRGKFAPPENFADRSVHAQILEEERKRVPETAEVVSNVVEAHHETLMARLGIGNDTRYALAEEAYGFPGEHADNFLRESITR